MKIFREAQCRECESKIPANVVFCKYCKRDRFLGFPQYEWLLIFLVLFGCIGSFGLAQVIPVKPLPSTTPIKSKSTLTLMPPLPSQTPVMPTITAAPSLTRSPSPTTQIIIALTSTPDYFGGTVCPGAPSVKVQVNDLVMVITSNNDKLKLRSKPIIDPSTEIRKLGYGSYLKIHDGPVCVKDSSNGISYWFWEVKDRATGQMGWVADGDSNLYYIKKAK